MKISCMCTFKFPLAKSSERIWIKEKADSTGIKNFQVFKPQFLRTNDTCLCLGRHFLNSSIVLDCSEFTYMYGMV
jgi:hypothetical protein